MSSQENTSAEEGTEVLSNHGWSQFGKTPPQRGRFGGGPGFGGQAQGPFGTAVLPSPPPKPRGDWRRRAGAAAVLTAVALGGGVAGGLIVGATQGGETVVTTPVVRTSSGSGTASLVEVAKAVMPSVVSLKVQTFTGGGEGSGVILSADGLILTNNHVVSGVRQGGTITVKFSDGKTASAVLKGTDPTTDLAVVQAQGVSGLTPAALGDSDKLQVGEPVLAIGSPLGLEGSVTAGIVSALDRTLTESGDEDESFPWGRSRRQRTTIGGMIQTDAAINPGNSGGALVNAAGQVIGINTAIATAGSQGNIGVGFAIPINTAKRIADQLAESGTATHAFLGVTVRDTTVQLNGRPTPGAEVGSVTGDGPAAQAGVTAGDVITKIGDRRIEGADDVVAAVRGFKPGDRVTITVVRDGKERTVTVTLGETRPGQ